MGKKAPKPPDYTGAADKQSQASRDIASQQTYANRPNQTTPWGQVNWGQEMGIDPATGRPVTNWSQNMTLTPELQAALDQQIQMQGERTSIAQGLMGNVRENMENSGAFWNTLQDNQSAPDIPGYSALPNVPPGLMDQIEGGFADVGGPQRGFADVGGPQREIDSSGRYNDEASDALYERMMGRLQPRFQRESSLARSRLAGMGLKPGDEMSRNQMGELYDQQGEAYQKAALDSTIFGGQEASRMFGMDLAGAQFGNMAQNQAYGQALGRGQFGNMAQNQAYGQALGRGQFGNMAVGMQNQMQNQNYGMQMQNSAMQDQQTARQFQQGLQGAGFNNQVRQQQIVEEMQRQGWDLNQINALLTGQQVQQPQMPGFMGASAGQAPQYLAAANMGYQGQLDAFNAQQMGMQGLMSGVGGMMMGMGPMGLGMFGT